MLEERTQSMLLSDCWLVFAGEEKKRSKDTLLQADLLGTGTLLGSSTTLLQQPEPWVAEEAEHPGHLLARRAMQGGGKKHSCGLFRDLAGIIGWDSIIKFLTGYAAETTYHQTRPAKGHKAVLEILELVNTYRFMINQDKSQLILKRCRSQDSK